MPQTYIVKPGDFLPKIASTFGFSDFHTIWNAPENADLKQQRKNPNVLFPGDSLTIPDLKPKEVDAASEQRHTFKLHNQKLKLRIQLLGLKKEPQSGHNCTLIIDSTPKDLKTNSDGIVEQDLPVTATAARLTDKDKPDAPNPLTREFNMKIGFLDPIDKISGQVARLNNLGYDAGDLSDQPLTPTQEDALENSPRFKSAVEEFQCDFMGHDNLSTIQQVVDGKCGSKTQDKLLEIHGC